MRARPLHHPRYKSGYFTDFGLESLILIWVSAGNSVKGGLGLKPGVWQKRRFLNRRKNAGRQKVRLEP